MTPDQLNDLWTKYQNDQIDRDKLAVAILRYVKQRVSDEDSAQDITVSVVCRINGGRVRTVRLSNYVSRAIRNKGHDDTRQRIKERQRHSEVDPDALSFWAGGEMVSLRSLPAEIRALANLILMGHTFLEASQLLNTPASTLKRRLAKYRKKLANIRYKCGAHNHKELDATKAGCPHCTTK